MDRFPYTAKALLLGLVVAQAIASVQVYISNAELHHTLLAIKDAGYLPVPNQKIMGSLQQFGPAVLGGLFFTLSIGAGLSLLSLGTAWIWDRLLSRDRFLLILFLLVWAGCVVGVNYRGFSPITTSYFLFILPLVFLATLRWMPGKKKRRVWLDTTVEFVPIILLALFWAPQMNKNFFLDFRDHMLLTNPLGIRINGFYYKYNLYAAEVFKSLDQKMLKTCNLKQIQDKALLPRMERDLDGYDYLNVGDEEGVDLKVTQKDSVLAFKNRGRVILETTPKDFFAGPGSVLAEFSSRSDRHAFFRKFTFYSLLIGFPITLYVLLCSLLRLELSFFLNVRTSSMIATISAFFIGIALLVTFHQMKGRGIEPKDVAQYLKSGRWQDRVASLKLIQEKGMEVADFPSYRTILKSSHVPERHWLARVLGVSRVPSTYSDLLTLLDDPQPIVVSKALGSLGQRGDRSAVREILRRIETSHDWDNQWYAYRALRTLGWKQRKSK